LLAGNAHDVTLNLNLQIGGVDAETFKLLLELVSLRFGIVRSEQGFSSGLNEIPKAHSLFLFKHRNVASVDQCPTNATVPCQPV